MALLTEFPSGYKKPEPLNKSFDMIVRDWSRQQFGGDDIVDEIRKALSTGVASQITAGGAVTAGNNNPGETTALRLENLDNTMTSVLATAEHLKIFRWLHKEPSKQPFYQWNRRESYGSTRGFFGFQEGGLPNGGKGQWSRNGAYVKFLGTKGGVTHPAVLTNILGGMSVDPVAEDQLGRTMDFMQRIERAVMYGDEDIYDVSGSDANYDGILKQLTQKRSKNIIDLEGKPLTLDVIANVASRLVSEGKLLSFNDISLFMSPQNIEDFGKLRYSTILGTNNEPGGPGTRVDRADLTTSARNNLIAGLSIVGQATSFGVIPFEWSIFTEPVEGSDPLVTGDPSAPAAPLNNSPLYANRLSTQITSASNVASDLDSAVAVVSKRVSGTVTTSLSATYYRRDQAPGSAMINGTRDGTGYSSATSLSTPSETTTVTSYSDSGGTPYINEGRICHNITVAAASSKHDASDTTFYWYRASSVNDNGESAASYVSSGAVSPSKDYVVKFLIPRVQGTGLAAARAYRIYRLASTVENPTYQPSLSSTTVGVGTAGWQFVGYVADPGVGDWVEFTDSNGASSDYTNFRPGTNIAPLLCRNSADLCVAQMSPLLKMPLAPTSTTFEYLLLLYHTLVLKAPERQFIFKNVGKLN
jgi:hypothetical protein